MQPEKTNYIFVPHIFLLRTTCVCVRANCAYDNAARPIKSNQGACHWTISAAVCVLDLIIIYILNFRQLVRSVFWQNQT